MSPQTRLQINTTEYKVPVYCNKYSELYVQPEAQFEATLNILTFLRFPSQPIYLLYTIPVVVHFPLQNPAYKHMRTIYPCFYTCRRDATLQKSFNPLYHTQTQGFPAPPSPLPRNSPEPPASFLLLSHPRCPSLSSSLAGRKPGSASRTSHARRAHFSR